MIAALTVRNENCVDRVLANLSCRQFHDDVAQIDLQDFARPAGSSPRRTLFQRDTMQNSATVAIAGFDRGM
jgi:hypothetical protein